MKIEVENIYKMIEVLTKTVETLSDKSNVKFSSNATRLDSHSERLEVVERSCHDDKAWTRIAVKRVVEAIDLVSHDLQEQVNSTQPDFAILVDVCRQMEDVS